MKIIILNYLINGIVIFIIFNGKCMGFLPYENSNNFKIQNNMKTKHGFEIIDSKLPIHNVIERLTAMRPENEEFPEFDKTKKDDYVYCIEWGMIKQREHERAVYNKMIDDLKNAL